MKDEVKKAKRKKMHRKPLIKKMHRGPLITGLDLEEVRDKRGYDQIDEAIEYGIAVGIHMDADEETKAHYGRVFGRDDVENEADLIELDAMARMLRQKGESFEDVKRQLIHCDFMKTMKIYNNLTEKQCDLAARGVEMMDRQYEEKSGVIIGDIQAMQWSMARIIDMVHLIETGEVVIED